MAGRQAKILNESQTALLLSELSKRRHPLRNRVIGLLSFKAGLRAAEISKLDWSGVLDPSGAISNTLALEDRIAKKRHGRTIPMHAELRRALEDWKRICGGKGPVIRSERGGASPVPSEGRSFVDLDHGIFYRLAMGQRATNKRQPPAPIPLAYWRTSVAGTGWV